METKSSFTWTIVVCLFLILFGGPALFILYGFASEISWPGEIPGVVYFAVFFLIMFITIKLIKTRNAKKTSH